MIGRYLLDTNIVIALFGGDVDVIRQIAGADEVFVSSIVLGELYYGAHNSSRVEANLSTVELLRTTTAVLSCDAATAAQYGKLKFELRRAGTPIPENDIWVAALAAQHGLTLVSRDQHFAVIKSLVYEIW